MRLRFVSLLLAGAFAASVVLTGTANAGDLNPDTLKTALVKLEEMAAQSIAAGQVPGLAIVVVYKDDIAYLKGFGVREEGQPASVDADTVFQLASFSKPISSTTVAALVGAGKLTWDTRIAEIAPDYQLRDGYPSQQVTVGDLFAHRSGIPGGGGNDLEDIGYDRETVMHRLALLPPSSSFRAGYDYSNAGLTMGALAAARTTGKDWETVSDEMLYAPLGMTSTSSRHSDFVKRTNAAKLHVRIDGKWTALVERSADVQAPAGGVSSTVRDLAQWMRLELGRGAYNGEPMIDAAAIARTHQPVMPRGNNPVTGSPSFYALGWNVEYTRHGLQWGHAGAFSQGARTLVTLLPESELGIVILANAFPSGVPEGLADSFLDMAFDGALATDYMTPWNDAYEGMFEPAVQAAAEMFAKPPAPATQARPLDAYAGRYNNAYAGDGVVSDEAGVLTLKLGPDGGTSYALTHFDRDTFIYYADPEMPTMPSTAVFALAPDGKAASITLQTLNSGVDTLVRAAN